MNRDDEPVPDSLRSVIGLLRAPSVDPSPAADDRLRSQVRTMVRAMAPVLPDPPPGTSGAAPPASPARGPWKRAAPFATFGAGVGAGALLHALLATPQVLVVTREAVRPTVITAPSERRAPIVSEAAGAPPASLSAAVAPPPSRPPSPATTNVPRPASQTERGGNEGGDDDARLRAQLVRVEQLLEEGAAREALSRVRELDRRPIRSPALAGLREVLAVRALRASGDEAGAHLRGERYVARHPGSSYAREIHASLGRSGP